MRQKSFSSGVRWSLSPGGKMSYLGRNKFIQIWISKISLFFLLKYSWSTMLWYLHMYRLAIQVFCRSYSIIVYDNILGIIPCAIQSVFVDYLFYGHCLFYGQQFVSVNPKGLTCPSPPWWQQVCSLYLWLYFCFVSKFICTVFLDSTYMC